MKEHNCTCRTKCPTSKRNCLRLNLFMRFSPFILPPLTFSPAHWVFPVVIFPSSTTVIFSIIFMYVSGSHWFYLVPCMDLRALVALLISLKTTNAWPRIFSVFRATISRIYERKDLVSIWSKMASKVFFGNGGFPLNFLPEYKIYIPDPFMEQNMKVINNYPKMGKIVSYFVPKFVWYIKS